MFKLKKEATEYEKVFVKILLKLFTLSQYSSQSNSK